MYLEDLSRAKDLADRLRMLEIIDKALSLDALPRCSTAWDGDNYDLVHILGRVVVRDILRKQCQHQISSTRGQLNEIGVNTAPKLVKLSDPE